MGRLSLVSRDADVVNGGKPCLGSQLMQTKCSVARAVGNCRGTTLTSRTRAIDERGKSIVERR